MLSNMLLSVKIKNFKSLKETSRIGLEKNTFLIGLNGSGKSSILQAIDFLSAISTGKVKEWLENRTWDKKDLTFFGNKKSIIEFETVFQLGGKTYFWAIAFNSQTLKCTSELLFRKNDDNTKMPEILEVKNGSYSINKGKKEKINFKYSGSILSALESRLFGEELTAIHSFFNDIHSAELLTPMLMKKKAREAKNDIGIGGEKLSAFINALDKEKKQKLHISLQSFFPNIKSFETKSLRSGWKTLSLVEVSEGEDIVTDSMHLSDGVLRIMAILSQLLTTESILIFDEIEDGINQEFVEKLVDILVDSSHQTIVATHSPLLLNYLDDEIAKKSILFVYKTRDGSTKIVNFFDAIAKHKDMSEHELDMFGPGEVMQSVDLLELSELLVNGMATNENSD